MKICFVTTISATIESFVLPLAEFLHDNTDWDISFICSDDEQFEKNLPDYIHFYPVHMERGISIAGIQAMLKIKKILKNKNFDIVQYSTPNASLYTALAAYFTKTPVRLYCQWGIAYVGFHGIKRKIFKLIEKFVCKLSTWIEPDSKGNLVFAHQEGLYPEDKGSVIWNGSACGVNLNKFDIKKKQYYRKLIREQYNIEEDSLVYIFIGRVTRDKGINELLEAYRELDNKHSFLFIVGNNEIDNTINKELYQWSINDRRIIYTGNTEQVERYLSASDVYILPSYREGFGLSVIEAQAMGIPVIVSDIPGPRDAIIKNETGFLCNKGDYESLLSMMVKISTVDLDEVGFKGRTFVENNFEQNKLFGKILLDRKRLIEDINK